MDIQPLNPEFASLIKELEDAGQIEFANKLSTLAARWVGIPYGCYSLGTKLKVDGGLSAPDGALPVLVFQFPLTRDGGEIDVRFDIAFATEAAFRAFQYGCVEMVAAMQAKTDGEPMDLQDIGVTHKE
jgi:hypothetical protein